jgi:hypothetical protein
MAPAEAKRMRRIMICLLKALGCSQRYPAHCGGTATESGQNRHIAY